MLLKKKLSKKDLKQKVKPWITSALQISIKKGTNYFKNSYVVKMLREKLLYTKITNIIETKL